jgi:hypothetical protein
LVARGWEEGGRENYYLMAIDFSLVNENVLEIDCGDGYRAMLT